MLPIGAVARANGNGMMVVDGFAPYGDTAPSAWPGQAGAARDWKPSSRRILDQGPPIGIGQKNRNRYHAALMAKWALT